ncbi:MAG: preprotein translocase subunit SecG [Maritimibacter sp.]|jgi:preprotein translocase subunit SecG
MQNVLLIILLILALALIAVVLLQRSEGGGLGMGGGASNGVVSARGAASALHKMTWVLGIAFLAISLTMTVVSRLQSDATSVIDRVGDAPAAAEETTTAPTSSTDAAIDTLMPPSATDGASDSSTTADAPVTPPRAD